MKNSSEFIQFFRQAAPYIHQHRNKTFVFCIQDDTDTKSALQSLLHDIAILHSLRVRIVVVFGSRYTLNNALKDQTFHNNHRITDAGSMKVIQEIMGTLRIRIESILSMGLANSPMEGASIQTTSGNFVTAKPIGVREGVDFGLTGEVRKIHKKSINKRLKDGDIVIIPPIGYSSTGEVFTLTTEEIASEIAVSLGADKLLFISQALNEMATGKNAGKAITPDEAADIEIEDNPAITAVIKASVKASKNGVKRIHLMPKEADGALLAELFSRDGVGLMITNQAYDRIEQATIEDIPSLLALIRPLEKEGVLIRRSRELLEMEIGRFSLLKRDNTVIGCAALYPYPKQKMAELSCLVVSPEYRSHGLAELLLAHIEKSARQANVNQLFCLTTHTSHWFLERGFSPTPLESLPPEKQAFYNAGRRSKTYIKRL